jgi:hypothetical protein
MRYPRIRESNVGAARWPGLAVMLGIVLLLAGASCGGGAKPVFPVNGKVFYQGKPTHKAIVWLHPENPSDSTKSTPPRGVVQQDGSFQISTFQPNDGAPPGRYRVSISWRVPSKVGDDEGEQLLPRRYQDPATSGLPPVEVKEGANELPPFQLTN